jgi:hypothetical protein
MRCGAPGGVAVDRQMVLGGGRQFRKDMQQSRQLQAFSNQNTVISVRHTGTGAAAAI